MNEKDEQAFKIACDALYAWGYSEQFSRSLWITALEYARNKQAEPVYAYRRRGLNEFCTCDERRYKELSAKPSLFEVAVFYTHPAPVVAQGEADGWHFKFNSGAESFVTNVDAADLIRMGLQAGETCTEYFKKAITAEVGLSKTETTTEAPAVAQSWELNEETAKFLADLILANDEPTPVTLSVGFIKDDDGKIQHGLRVHESEYPEEGAELLVESTPSPQKAPPAEVVRELVEALVLILPLAKGYAATNNVGSNQGYCNAAEAALKSAKEHWL